MTTSEAQSDRLASLVRVDRRQRAERVSAAASEASASQGEVKATFGVGAKAAWIALCICVDDRWVSGAPRTSRCGPRAVTGVGVS
jgi:hypothetical protein